MRQSEQLCTPYSVICTPYSVICTLYSVLLSNPHYLKEGIVTLLYACQLVGFE